VKVKISGMSGVIHGMAWKGASLVAKAGFLFLIAPFLPEMVFSQYVFLTTVSLLSARFLALGLSDQLVLEIRGSMIAMTRFQVLYRKLFAISAGLLAGTIFWESSTARAVVLTFILVASSILEGMVRSIRPSLYERLLNGPPILFILLVVLVSAPTASQLLLLYGFATAAVQLIVAITAGVWRKRSGTGVDGISFVDFTGIARRGSSKMVSELTLVTNMRGLIVLPKLLTGHLVSDSLAFALSIAEAFSTFPMVIVNRNYASRANASNLQRYSRRSASAILAGMMTIAAAAYILWPLVPAAMGARLQVIDLVWAIVFFGCVTVYYDLRYYYWVATGHVGRLTAWQIGFFLIQVIVVAVLPAKLMLPAVALTAAILLGFWLILLYDGPRNFRSESNDLGN
jgi:hypothetical protein